MQQQNKPAGNFTLPGESGYEALTLDLAKRWGADVIRDSDGTTLSDEILRAGYDIYSTICIIRDHNPWIEEHLHTRQQVFLMSKPVTAGADDVSIPLMDGYFEQQFEVNTSDESILLWQVYDRTTGQEVDSSKWWVDVDAQRVVLEGVTAWHRYTVNFLAYRVWEEISMYNHTTNNWDSEHLMQLDPVHPEAQEYLVSWLDTWCKQHPDTDVIRFTSLFYNFVWIWGSDVRNRNLFTDWGSYDFAVSPLMLHNFSVEYGYNLTSEDFINKGKRHAVHRAPTQQLRDWMEFVCDFVREFGKKLVAIAHKYNKKAYVFYDDSWVGLEPYNGRFEEFGFDGLIKCVFSGFEARLCSGAKGVQTHELRLHPYLFPVGLGGAPSFSEGGDPTLEAKRYWIAIRRALLRAPIDRIGLGGYLHLTEDFPEFVDYIEKTADEFREIQRLHRLGGPVVLPIKVAVLTAWGKLRSWTCSGHFHENPQLDLINIIESLSGLPLEVEFIDFADVQSGILQDVDVVINAGTAGSAWSGGQAWTDANVVAKLTQWVAEGGVFFGVGQPSAIEGYDYFFQMAEVLGVDGEEQPDANICHGKWTFTIEPPMFELPENLQAKHNVTLTDGNARVLQADGDAPVATVHSFGKGKGVYLSSYTHSFSNARALLNTLFFALGSPLQQTYLTDNPMVECAWYPEEKTLVAINNSEEAQQVNIATQDSLVSLTIAPFDTVMHSEE